MTQPLRVASYNLRDFKDDRAAAVRVVRALGPDVLCVQEAPRHPFSGHRVAAFAADCGMYWSGGHRRAGGVTVLTSLRVQVHQIRHVRLPVRVLRRPRGYAVARVSLPGHGHLTAVSAHLGLDDSERRDHAERILAELPQDEPVLLAGDLNESAEGAAFRAVAERLPPVSADRPTFTARHPRVRLDVIFAVPGLPCGSPEAVSLLPEPSLDPQDLAAASDHLPVWVDLDITSWAG